MNEGMLAGKVVVVTGGGEGIGRAACLLFAAEGAVVCIAEINARAAAATVTAIEQNGGQSCWWPVDVSDERQVGKFVDDVVAKYGRLDGAFNNAGVEMANRLVPDLTHEEWSKTVAVNLSGVFYCMKHESRVMSEQGGAIVNMSSGDGIIGQPYAADYVASKHGVIGLTRAASCEARYTKVRVNALMPGLILTPMVEERLMNNPAFEAQMGPMKERHSIGRYGIPEDVAEAACWLLSDRSAFINGAMLAVDGGYTAR